MLGLVSNGINLLGPEAVDKRSSKTKRSSESGIGPKKHENEQFRFAKRESGKPTERQFRFQAKRAPDAEK